MKKINFEVGKIITPAKVNEDKTITPAVWEGTTPLSPFILNKLQDNIENDQIEQNTVIDELKAKTIKCLQEVETPTPVSGTSIDLSDSADAKITELKISGNSRQETRNGKNKLNSASIGVGTNNGITCTYDSKTGIITFNGACNTDNTRFTFENTSIPFTNNLTKTLAYYVSGSITTYCSFRTFDSKWSAGETLNLLDLSSSKNKTRIISSNTTIKTNIDIRFNNGSVANNFQIKLMITDSENDDYEQYGASPSPDYPSEVESCGDNINLFDKNDITNNTSIDVRNGNTYTDNNSFSTNFIKINGITELCCNGLSDTSKLWGAIYDENKSYIKGINTTNGIFNETNLSGATYIRLGLLKTYLDTMKLEKGLIASPYSPYGQGCINEVICNKNFLKLNDVKERNKNGLTYSCENGIIKINGTATTGTMIDFDSFEMPAGIYKMSRNASGTYNASWQNYLRNSDGNFIDGAIGEERFTFNEKKNVLFRIFINSNSTFENYIMKPQVELGSISTDYIEHKSQTYTIPTQQPFRANGDIRDTFIKKNNKWYEHHPVIRKIFDGTEDWNLYTSDNARRFGLSITGNMPKLITTTSNGMFGKGLCSHFETQMNYTTTDLILFVQIANPIWYIGITDFNSKWANVTALKEWLSSQYNAGTPVYVDYVLQTPLDIECTEEQSTILFDIEQNAKTYDKVTHMYSTDNVSPVIEVTYKKDIETLFANTLVEGV